MVLRHFSSRIATSSTRTAVPAITTTVRAAAFPLSSFSSRQSRWNSTTTTATESSSTSTSTTDSPADPSLATADAAAAENSAASPSPSPSAEGAESKNAQDQQLDRQLGQQDAVRQDLPISYVTPKPVPSPGERRKRANMTNFIKDKKPYLAGTYAKPDIVLSRGKGSLLWDMDRQRYTDFTSGIGVCSLGHGDDYLAKVISQQASALLHSSNLFHNMPAADLSKLLISCTHRSGAFPAASKVFLSNSGTEANEAAIKFARRHARSLDPSGRKNEILSFNGSFHGRTFGALSATPNEKYRAPFGPMLSGFKTGEFNNVERVNDLVTEDTAGVIVEPIQGEGGINPATSQFLRALRDRCTEVGAVLIYDEIQCGLQRTGTLWAHKNEMFKLAGGDEGRAYAFPDILTSAKALGNGLPIGATLISEKIDACLKPGDHGTTFGGNPLACAGANWVLRRLVCEDIHNNVVSRTRQFGTYLRSIQRKFPQVIQEKRGAGLMIGVQLTDEYAPKIGVIVQKCRESGLLILTAGHGVIRLLPPLNIGRHQVKNGCYVLEQVIREVVMDHEGLNEEEMSKREAEALAARRESGIRARSNVQPMPEAEKQSSASAAGEAVQEQIEGEAASVAEEATEKQAEGETTPVAEEKEAETPAETPAEAQAESQSEASAEPTDGEGEKQNNAAESAEEKKQ